VRLLLRVKERLPIDEKGEMTKPSTLDLNPSKGSFFAVELWIMTEAPIISGKGSS